MSDRLESASQRVRAIATELEAVLTILHETKFAIGFILADQTRLDEAFKKCLDIQDELHEVSKDVSFNEMKAQEQASHNLLTGMMGMAAMRANTVAERQAGLEVVKELEKADAQAKGIQSLFEGE